MEINSTEIYYYDNENITSYVPYDQRVETYLVPIVFLVIFIVGVLGNGTLVFVFARHRNMRSVPNTYIFSLALGDLLVIVVCVPFTSTLYTLESWPYGTLVCKISEVTKDISIGVSVFTLTALSAERYCAIVNPLRRRSAGAGSATVIIALLIWAFATILAVPAAIYSTSEEHYLRDAANTSIKVCTPFPRTMGRSYPVIMVVSRFLSYYALPLVVIAGFYVCMARHLEFSTRHLPGDMTPGHLGNASAQIRARKKVAKMVLAFVVIFVLCFLPHHVVCLWFFIDPNSERDYNGFWHVLRILGFCLTFLNSCVNPVALYFVSGVFRKHFNHYLFCCVSGTRDVRPQPIVTFRSTRSHQAPGCGSASNLGVYNYSVSVASGCSSHVVTLASTTKA